MNKRLLPLLLFFACCMEAGGALYAQTNLEVFGQNRIQYRRFDWKFYDAKHFKIYHYDRSGRELARYVAEQAEQDITAIEHKLGGLFPDRVNIIVYNSYDDFQQSNIGLNGELHMQNDNPAGTVNLVGDKLVIYFTGKHADLKRQLRQGMAKVVMERMMFGENFREMVRNAFLLNLPAWVTEGYVDYVVDGWTTDDDNDWKNLVMGSVKVDFHELAEQNPRLGGKAFWKYIAIRYGEHNVINLLYLTQLKSSLNKAMPLTVQQKLRPTYDSLLAFYQDRYAFEEQIFEPMDTVSLLTRIKVPADEGYIRDVMVSPRGSDVAYVAWKQGEYSVILQRTQAEEGKEQYKPNELQSGGIKNYMEHPDPDYPLLAWNNTGFKLGIIFKNRDRLRIRVYNSVKGKMEDFRIPANRFDRITGFTFMEDDDKIILSAIKRGQSDLYEYRLKGGRMTQITDDAWDDAAPVFVSGGSRKGIIFLSNRPSPFINIKPLPNELPAGPMNAYFYNSTTASYELLQLTYTGKGTVAQAIPYGSDHFAYLYDQNGVRSRYVVLFGRNAQNQDSAYSLPMTNFSRSILYHQYNPASGKIADVIQEGKIYNIFFHPIVLPPPDGEEAPRKPLPLSFVDGVAGKKRQTDVEPINMMDRSGGSDPNSPFDIKTGEAFQGAFSRHSRSDISDSAAVEPGLESIQLARKLAVNEQADSGTLLMDQGSLEDDQDLAARESSVNGKRILYVDSTFIELRSQPYRLSFKPDFFSVRLDKGVLFNRYQSYNNTGGQYTNPSLAGMLTASLFDKMEDYRLTGGLRIPANFSGLTYFLQFENFRRRVDWGIVFLRQENKYTYNFLIDSTVLVSEPGKTVANMVQGSASYPLDKVRSIRMHLSLRQDKMVVKAQDAYGLVLPNTQDFWTMSRVEFVHDNTRNPTFNIWNGLRYKIFGEYLYKIYSDNASYSIGDPSRMTSQGGFYNAGFDFRYYQKLHKNFIAAIRLAGAHSGGNQQILYFLGGVDNALNASFNNALQPSLQNNYAFQALATNLRGYDQNARNGNTYAVMNAELRFPVLNTLLKRPVQSSILRHLQVVGFVDMGSAWEGLLPSEANFQRNSQVSWPPNSSSPTIKITLPDYHDKGLAIGYGVGLRTMLFGYFARFDAAWNIRKDFMWYISLGTDF